MTLVFVFVILVGAVFGMRLKVMVLVPATIIACGLVIAAGLSGGSTTGAMALAAAALAVCLQIGYVGGSATRMFIAASAGETIAVEFKYCRTSSTWRILKAV